MATNVETLLQELVAIYDDTIDTGTGSSFHSQVITPLLARLGDDPLSVDAEALIQQVVEEYDDTIDTSDYSDFRDLVIRIMSIIQEPLRREIAGIKVGLSLNDYEAATRAEVDALLGNYFTALGEGGVATGTVRVWFYSPQSATFSTLMRFYTGGGLNFYPSATQSISATQMSFQQAGSLYYADVTVTAEARGSDYSVGAGAIIGVSGLAGVARVSNTSSFAVVADDETKAEGVERAQTSVTQRTLATLQGIGFVLDESYSAYAPFQVIGKGEDEMERDIVWGPAMVSGLPGGIVGDSLPSVGAGAHIHIGGMTDVYAYQPAPDTGTLEIADITDWGVRVAAGTHGYTQAGGATSIWRDDHGHFATKGVAAGDKLRLGADLYDIDVVSEGELEIDGSLDGSMYEQTYEVVRQYEGYIDIPLFDLVALDSSGEAVLDDDDNPVQPTPGDPDLGQLLDELGEPVVKSDNICEGNLQLPLVAPVSVQHLDPLTLEATGTYIPCCDVVLVTTPAGFTGGGPAAKAAGLVRVFFREAVNAWADWLTTRFTYQTRTFRPVRLTGPTYTARIADVGGTLTLILEDDYTAEFSGGWRFLFDGTVWEALSLTEVAGETHVTTRVEPAAAKPSATFSALKGVLEADMQQDEDTGLYYMDVLVEALLNGAAGNLAADTELAVTAFKAEGWTVHNLSASDAFSTREKAYLRLTRWVNDDVDLEDPLTAPAVQLYYRYASGLSSLQDFVESEDERCVGEDILIKHYRPLYVAGDFLVGGITEEAAGDLLEETINAVAPDDGLEVADLVDELKGSATRVRSPLTLVALGQDAQRRWTAEVVDDTVSTTRIKHLVYDAERTTITAE